jgi:hypothetical protein
MTEYTNIEFKGEYIKAESRARKSLEWARRFWSEVVKACEKNNCYKVLGVSESLVVMPFLDGLDHADLFNELGIDRKYRIAWVELNEEATDTVAFVDDFLYNRGLPGRLFQNEEEAKTWLLEEDGF